MSPMPAFESVELLSRPLPTTVPLKGTLALNQHCQRSYTIRRVSGESPQVVSNLQNGYAPAERPRSASIAARTAFSV